MLDVLLATFIQFECCEKIFQSRKPFILHNVGFCKTKAVLTTNITFSIWKKWINYFCVCFFVGCELDRCADEVGSQRLSSITGLICVTETYRLLPFNPTSCDSINNHSFALLVTCSQGSLP